MKGGFRLAKAMVACNEWLGIRFAFAAAVCGDSRGHAWSAVGCFPGHPDSLLWTSDRLSASG